MMTRKLTEQEIEVSIIAWREQKRRAFTEAARDGVYPELHAFFDDGFRAGLDYQQAQPADPLMEAAPELLAALRMVEARIDDSPGGRVYFLGEEIDQITAAIARAEPEGEE